MVDGSQIPTSIVAHSGNERRDDLAIAGVHHTMGKLTEVMHEAAQCVL
jgi:hypothetical protein